ncbi:MAG: tetratricopeptide repeat protein [Spirochaetales bacterium]|nr:tetratricopeptide repeat protein [Spirochaetales bacterium]
MKRSINRSIKTHRKRGSILGELILLFLLVSIIFLMVFFNDIITHLGFKELQTNLSNLNRKNSRRDFLGMVSRYKLQKELYENKTNDSDFAVEELKINSLISSSEKSFAEIKEKYKELLPAALFFVNSIRFTMGREPLSINTEDPARHYLDVAYYYERNKLFKKALEIYEKTMGVIRQENDSVPVIQLHQGFCFSIIGDYENARDKYTTVITTDRNPEVTKTAKILLSYLDDIQQEIINVMNSDADPIEKGEKLYKLMAYDEAIKLLDNAEPENQEDLEKVQYYKARSLEEKGETKNAVEIYQDIITQDPDSDYAVMSNRRILALGAVNDNNKDLKELADKNNQLIGDGEYTLYSESLAAAAGESGGRSLEDILKDSYLSPEITSDLLNENDAVEKEKNDFIDEIVTAVVKEDKDYTIKNTAFYEQAIKKLEQVKQELEERNAVLEKEKQRTENQRKKLKELEKKNVALEANKRLIEDQLQKLKEEKNAALEEEKQLIEKRLNDMEQTIEKNQQERSAMSGRLEVVEHKDRFGRIILKYRYGYDEAGNKYTDSYSIYYYGDFDELYKVVDYNGKNEMTAYYLIIYDEQEEQIKIKKYDENNNLIYVD